MELFVPGRICLFGEHSDWAGSYRRQNSRLEGGMTIITGTNQGLHARVRPCSYGLRLRSVLPGGEVKSMTVPMDPAALLAEAQGGGFFSYAAGTAYQVLVNWKVGGLEIDNHLIDLPIKKGLSSSAALCVLVARAFNRVYGLRLTTRGEMDLAYRGEITTPSRCGRMDQGCAYGARPLLMRFDQDDVRVEELAVGGEFHLLIVDLKGRKDTVRILADLNQSYPFTRTERDREVQEYLGPINRGIVTRAVAALGAGDAAGLGALMTEAQARFDRCLAPSSPEELAAPRLHALLGCDALRPLTWGGKGVGSQGDGAAQLVCRDEASRARCMEIIGGALGMDCLPLDIRPASRVARVLIPAAGFGSELFPASKAVQKELFPIIDSDGVAKPVLLAHLEEAQACGIEHAVVVVRPEDSGVMRRFFGEHLPPERAHRLPAAQKPYERKVLDLGLGVTLVTQDQPLGFGHAVWTAREALAGGPFVLFLGDYVYRSTEGRSCLRQLLDVYERTRRSVIGVKRIDEGALDSSGVLTGAWTGEEGLLDVAEVAEKPGPRYAREHLRVPGFASGEYLGLCGMYVLGEEILGHLDAVIAHRLDVAGQFELTVALDRMRAQEGCLACVVRGESYDIGVPDGYLAALAAFRASVARQAD